MIKPGNFLVLHGWQNRRPPGHWQRWLADELSARGHTVRYPQLPDPDHPCLAQWISAIETDLAAMSPHQRVVIGHSLSCVAWLHLARTASAQLPVHRVLLVAPPSRDFLLAEPALASFADPPRPSPATTGSETAPLLICSDNDPYCPPDDYMEYSPAFTINLIPGEGHFDATAGYGDWPSLLRWCEDPRISVGARRVAVLPPANRVSVVDAMD